MNVQLPPPHTVFPESEQRRVQSQGIRYAVAMEEARDLLQEHMQDYLSPEIMAVWGEPDRARNALASVCHALATPGHYGRAPQVIAADPAVAASLNDEMRGIWARQQHVEFLAYACGSVATLLTVLPADDDGTGSSSRRSRRLTSAGPSPVRTRRARCSSACSASCASSTRPAAK